MLFSALPNVSSDKPFEDEKIHAIHQMIGEQLNDLTLLCTIAEYLYKFKGQGIDSNDVNKYQSKIHAVSNNQKQRFEKLDKLIYENIIAIKKEQTTDKTILRVGKDARKLEAGLRTLKLFVLDVLKMLEPNSDIVNRVDERLYYFKNRSSTLEKEMKTLQNFPFL